MATIIYKGVEYTGGTGDTVVNIDLNDSGYSKEAIDLLLADLEGKIPVNADSHTHINKNALDKIDENTTDIKAVFNGRNLAYEDDITTKVNDSLTSYITKDEASSTYATNALMVSTIGDLAVLKNRLDNINDNIAPTNYYTKDEVQNLLASAEVGLLVHFDDLTIAQKEELKGEKGDKGNQGEQGSSAYDVAVELGYPGTKEEWVKSLEGDSAYEIAVKQGYAYTVDSWLQSLKGEKGEKGDTGETGKSAFQIAVDNGLTSASTQTEWIAELKGEKGDSITSVEQTTTSDVSDGLNTVTVTLSNGNTSEFNVKNGTGIASVEQTTTSDVSEGFNVVTCTLTNGNTSEFNIKNGTGIASVEQTTTSDVSSGTNTITVTLTNGATSTFDVKNGAEGYALIPTTKIDDQVGRIWLV